MHIRGFQKINEVYSKEKPPDKTSCWWNGANVVHIWKEDSPLKGMKCSCGVVEYKDR